MSIASVAKSAVAAGVIRKSTKSRAVPQKGGGAPPQGPARSRDLAEELTKYIPSEVIGIVTGAYALVVSQLKNSPELDRWIIFIAVLGLLALILIYWFQLVAAAKKSDETIAPLEVAFTPCSAGQLGLVIICYLAWVMSLMSYFLPVPGAVIAGVFTLVVVHLIEPARKVFAPTACAH